MPNPYYNHGGYPIQSSSGASSLARAEFDAVTAGFALLPTLAGAANFHLKVNSTATALTSSTVVSDDGTTMTVAGNLAFSGSGRRFQADFSSKDLSIANRAMFQTSTANNSTFLTLLPSGTDTTSQFDAYANSDPMAVAVTRARLSANTSGTEINSGYIISGTGQSGATNTGFLPINIKFGVHVQSIFKKDGGADLGMAYSVVVPTLQLIADASGTRGVTITGAAAGGTASIGTSSGNLSLMPSTGNVVIGNTPVSAYRLNVTTGMDITNTAGSPIVNVSSRGAAGYQPAQLLLNRYSAAGGPTPDNATIGEIRFDGLDTGSAYANSAMIYAQAGVNAAGGPPTALVFITSTGGGAAAERARIGVSGRFETIGDTNAFNLVARARAADDLSSIVFTNNSGSTMRSLISVNTAGDIIFGTGPLGTAQGKWVHVASAVNLWQMQGATTGNVPYIGAISGTETNVGIGFYSKGNGSIFFQSQSGTSTEFAVLANGATTNRYVTVTGSNGGDPAIATTGGGISIKPAGTQTALFRGAGGFDAIAESAGAIGIFLRARSGDDFGVLGFYNNAGATEWARIQGEATGTGLAFATGNSATVQMKLKHVASATKWAELSGGAAGGNARVGAANGGGVQNLVLGSGVALATIATDGYVMIPSCAGAPTGVPSNSGAGQIAMHYDSNNNRIYFYNGAWRSVAVA